MSGAVLDTGALVAFERMDRTMIAIVVRAQQSESRLYVPAGVVAQAWRDGRKQARLAMLLNSPLVEVVPLTDTRARAAGQLCGARRTRDVVDASVVLLAREHGVPAITSDMDDLTRLDPSVTLIRV
ncbi:MAG TPA: PIN domain-containing protein [Archangium sp.]